MNRPDSIGLKRDLKSPNPFFSVRQSGLIALLLAASAALISCGGSSSSSAPVATNPPVVVDPLTPATPSDLDKVAAQYGIESGGIGGDAAGDGGAAGAAGDGSPLKGAVVTITDAKGNFVSGLTDSKGQYLLKYKTATFTAPLVLRVVDAGGNVLTSVTDETAAIGKVIRASINPLTDKITSDVLPASVSGTDKNFDGSKVDTTKLSLAKTNLVTSVKDALGTAGIADTSKFDPIKSVYTYDGTGVDAVIESISHARDAATGATQLQVKANSVQNNADGSVVAPKLITASTPLAAAQVILPSSPALTFAKLTALTDALNRCLALDPAARLADPNCGDGIDTFFSANYLSSSRTFGEDFRTLFSNANESGIQGSTIRNPIVLFTGKYPNSTASFDDLAVVEVTIRQPSVGPLGPNGALSSPVEYVQYLTFKRDDTLTKSKAGNWILHGNQRNYDISARTRYSRFTQVNPARSANISPNSPSNVRSSLDFFIGTTRYNPATKAYVSANLRAVRVKGPGLPSAGLVLVPTNVAGESDRLAIHNQSGTVSNTSMITSLSQRDFRLNAVAADGSALYSGFFPSAVGTPGVSNGQAWAIPPLTDFSSLQAYSLYTFEIFLNSNPGNSVTDATEFARILSPVTPPSAALSLPMNDMSPSNALVTPPLASTSTVLTQWINNLNAAPLSSSYVYAEERNPKGATSSFTVNKWNYFSNIASAYSLNSRPTSNTVTTGTNPAFPSLGNGVAGDYREIGGSAWQGRARVNNTVFWSN